jgi:hypothetical protein
MVTVRAAISANSGPFVARTNSHRLLLRDDIRGASDVPDVTNELRAVTFKDRRIQMNGLASVST